MTIFNPDNTTHTFKIIPRGYSGISTLSDLELTLLNESLNSDLVISAFDIDLVENGYLEMSFDATITEGQSFQVKIVDNGNQEIVFRGKAFSTNKSTQNYDINGSV